MLQQKCVKARALYDNIAEAPDELAFRKGDVLTVLEQNTSGLEGWWLCSLRGRQVINDPSKLVQKSYYLTVRILLNFYCLILFITAFFCSPQSPDFLQFFIFIWL